MKLLVPRDPGSHTLAGAPTPGTRPVESRYLQDNTLLGRAKLAAFDEMIGCHGIFWWFWPGSFGSEIGFSFSSKLRMSDGGLGKVEL